MYIDFELLRRISFDILQFYILLYLNSICFFLLIYHTWLRSKELHEAIMTNTLE